jgi:hypothetical protein
MLMQDETSAILLHLKLDRVCVCVHEVVRDY